MSREEVETTILQSVGKGEPRAPHPGWRHLRTALAKDGLALSDEELIQLPFAIEFSDELVQALDSA